MFSSALESPGEMRCSLDRHPCAKLMRLSDRAFGEQFLLCGALQGSLNFKSIIEKTLQIGSFLCAWLQTGVEKL